MFLHLGLGFGVLHVPSLLGWGVFFWGGLYVFKHSAKRAESLNLLMAAEQRDMRILERILDHLNIKTLKHRKG